MEESKNALESKNNNSSETSWWRNLTDLTKINLVKSLYGYDMSSDEIRRNISDFEIQELYYLRDIL